MPFFRYKAVDEKNQVRQGMIQAASQDLAAEILVDQSFTILSLAEEREGLLNRSLSFLNKVHIKDLVVFSRQLSVIVSATIPLVQGLRILIEQTPNPALKAVVSEVADDVEGGAKLSAALGRHPEVFSNFFIYIVKSGETSGKLDDVLNFLADQLEKDYDLSSKIRGMMVYPILVFCGLGIVGALMMIFVVPQLVSVLSESGVALPLSTRILISSSNFLVNFWWIVLIIFTAMIGAARFFVETDRGRYYWDWLKLRAPVFGQLIQKIIMVRFTRSLYTLLSGGVPLTKSLNITADVAGNVIYRDLILETVREVEDGNPIATVFLQSKEIPVMVSHMLNLGEKTGRIDDILEKLGNFYSREVNNTVNNLVTLIEPLVIIFMGILVGLLVSSIILPVYSVATSF